ncbi:MAG: flavodoxin domain-containing protein [Acidobacteriota bacterium]|nr:flavodoxin domain-containing protein [Acidobacteriota bacterium]
MKALVLYRSHYGNTRQVADEIAKELRAKGVDPVVTDLRGKLPDFADFGAVFIGAPTRMARVTGKALRTLGKLAKKGWGPKPVVVFDTYGPLPATPEELEKGKKWLFPGAAGLMQAKAQALGLNVYAKTLRCEVSTLKGPLKDGEMKKVASFIEEVAPFIQ